MRKGAAIRDRGALFLFGDGHRVTLSPKKWSSASTTKKKTRNVPVAMAATGNKKPTIAILNPLTQFLVAIMHLVVTTVKYL